MKTLLLVLCLSSSLASAQSLELQIESLLIECENERNAVIYYYEHGYWHYLSGRLDAYQEILELIKRFDTTQSSVDYNP